MAGPARGTMDFFAAQAAAKRRTAALVVWFALAYVGTVAGVWAGLGLLLAIGGPTYAGLAFAPELAAAVAVGVAVVTSIGTAVHRARLAAGGSAVATMLGGVPIDRGTADPGERRLVNVVEEMAIAAGLPVPALYVLPAGGINAFAAGFTPDRAVVAVTRGALDRLTRDELQGVVAHELSHVLNGDARLNLQLLALIGGITALAAVGRFLVEILRRPRVSRSRRDPTAAIVLAGLVLWLMGSIGAFFGRVIRAAVSRQRELLADAAAVQFTRNPEGLAGALAKIAQEGSRIESAFAPEAAHLFFANGLRSEWLATHPPIELRIRRLVPQGFARVLRRAAEEAALGPQPASGPGTTAAALTASGLVASAGNAGPAHVAEAGRILAALPAAVVDSARRPADAPALLCALITDPEPALRIAQLGNVADPDLRERVKRQAEALGPMARADRMAVLDLALPALDALPREAGVELVLQLRALAAADGRTTVFEWAVLRIVSRRVARQAGAARQVPITARTVGDVEVDLLDLLSVLAWAGARDETAAQAALASAIAVLGLAGWRVLPRDRVDGRRFEAVLQRLEGASPPLKSRILEACAASALADGVVAPAEGEIVRAVAASLGVPVPPLALAATAASAASTA